MGILGDYVMARAGLIALRRRGLPTGRPSHVKFKPASVQ